MTSSKNLKDRPALRETRFLLTGLIIATTFPAVAAANDSTYTKIDFDACETLFFSDEGGSVSLKCPGYRGIPVYYNEGDLRADVDFGTPNQFFETFGAFNSTGDTVEWRLAAGKPIAAILRFHLDPGDGGEKGQVLSVHKIGFKGKAGCAIAYVDARANPNANGLAREVADDRAPSFACGTDRPTYVGKVSRSGRGATAVND
ncbi:hypothetical protein [Fulvimarina sp. MAC3]|uniref:hypothetical protein n=1 Tax=Fulvimarina sp. MAC3 TaxID=3148887 RepID=UPI0031FC35F9